MIPAIILSAGESRRMGTLKPLLRIGNKNFLQHIVGELNRAGIAQIYIVVGHQAQRVIAECGVRNAIFVVNDNYQRGQFSSLQAGIRQLDEKSEAVLVCLGDQPQIKAEWVRSLTEAFRSAEPLIVVPKYRDKRGHPVLYSGKLFSEILAMKPTQTAHLLTALHPDEILEVEMDSRGVLLDADEPNDLDELRGYFSE